VAVSADSLGSSSHHTKSSTISSTSLPTTGQPNLVFNALTPAPQRRIYVPLGALLRRAAIRVCQPGPVDFQRSITSAGNRKVSNLRGFAETGRPRFFKTK